MIDLSSVITREEFILINIQLVIYILYTGHLLVANNLQFVKAFLLEIR